MSFVRIIINISRERLRKGFYSSYEPLDGLSGYSKSRLLSYLKVYLTNAFQEAQIDLRDVPRKKIHENLIRAANLLGIPLASI